jgi:hypothetical protein
MIDHRLGDDVDGGESLPVLEDSLAGRWVLVVDYQPLLWTSDTHIQLF